jgi:hypothetical protein
LVALEKDIDYGWLACDWTGTWVVGFNQGLFVLTMDGWICQSLLEWMD